MTPEGKPASLPAHAEAWGGLKGWEAEPDMPVSGTPKVLEVKVVARPVAQPDSKLEYFGQWEDDAGPKVEWPLPDVDPLIPPEKTPCAITRPHVPVNATCNWLTSEAGFRPYRTSLGEPRLAVPTANGTLMFDLSAGRNGEDYKVREYIAREFYRKKGAEPARDLVAVVEALRGRALDPTLPPERVIRTRIRIAPSGPVGAKLDLGDGSRRHIVVDGTGWRFERTRIPEFDRPASMLPLPEPVPTPWRDGFDLLWRHVHVVNERQRLLLLADLVHRLRPDVCQPVGVFQGGPGAAKSSSQRRVIGSLDPTTASDLEVPADPRDLAALAANHETIGFDNVSHLDETSADRLCRLSTGTAMTSRRLYTNHGEDVVVARPKMYLNGIDPLPRRGDLLQRVLIYEVPDFDRGGRLGERTLDEMWVADRPPLLGALLDLAAGTFAELARGGFPATDDRLADYVETLLAMCRAMEVDSTVALAALQANRELRGATLAEDEFTVAIREFVDGRSTTSDPHGSGSGAPQDAEFTASALADWLREVHPGLFLPRTDPLTATRVVGQRLARIIPDLQALGYRISKRREHKTTVYRIEGRPAEG